MGIQFEVLRPGNGSEPAKSSAVTVHYIGTDINGEEFDNSYEPGSPPTYKVTELTRGLIEGVRFGVLSKRQSNVNHFSYFQVSNIDLLCG